MRTVSAKRRIDVPAADVWSRIGDFHGLDTWHPAVAGVEPASQPGLRIVTMAHGGTATERLVEAGPSWHTYEPVGELNGMRAYRATLRVHDAGPDACVVEWSGRFEADPGLEPDLAARTTRFYESGLDRLTTSTRSKQP